MANLVIENTANVFEDDGNFNDSLSAGLKLSRHSVASTHVDTHLQGGREEGEGGREGKRKERKRK